MVRELQIESEINSGLAESVLDFLERRPESLHPHLQREMLRSASDLLDHALMQHQVPAYPSSVTCPPGITAQQFPVRSQR